MAQCHVSASLAAGFLNVCCSDLDKKRLFKYFSFSQNFIKSSICTPVLQITPMKLYNINENADVYGCFFGFQRQISGNEKSRSFKLQSDSVEICWRWGGKNVEAVHHVTSIERYWGKDDWRRGKLQHWSTVMYRLMTHMEWRALYLLGEPELGAFFMSLKKRCRRKMLDSRTIQQIVGAV